MNIQQLRGHRVEKALETQLRALLGGFNWLKGWNVVNVGGASDKGYDLLATGPLPNGKKAALCVECKADVRPSTFGLLAMKPMKPPPRVDIAIPLLASPVI